MLTVGEELRRKREEKGLSIKDVVDGTYIQAKFIIALECNDYSVFPAEVYAKGFLKNYAELLGLDAQQLLEVYKNTKDQVTPVYDHEYYKTVAGLEPDIQKVDNLEGRKASIQEALAADDNINDEVVKIIRAEQAAKAEPMALETETIEMLEPVELQPEVAPDKLQESTHLYNVVQEQEPDYEPASVEQLVEEARKEPTAFTEEKTINKSVPLVKRKQEPIEPEVSELDEQVDIDTKPTAAAQAAQQASFKQKLAEKRNNGKSNTKTIIMILLLLVVAVAAYFVLTGQDGSADNPAPKTSSINIFKPATSEPKVQAQSIELTGKVNARCWVSIVADGKTIFEDNLQPGTTFKWPAKENLKVTIGNVSALTDLKLNGKPTDLGQARNNVVEKTFALKDVK